LFRSVKRKATIIINQKNPAVETGNVRLRFAINLNIREKDLIKGLVLFFKSYEVKSSELSVNTASKNYYVAGEKICLQFSKFQDIINIIIPFFEEYKIVGVKSLDFSGPERFTFWTTL